MSLVHWYTEAAKRAARHGHLALSVEFERLALAAQIAELKRTHHS